MMTTTVHKPRRWAQPHPLVAGRHITAFTVEVISGELHPVADAELDVVYRYPTRPERWTRVRTDGDGRAPIVDTHPEAPVDVTVSCGRHAAETMTPAPGALVTLEA